MMMIPNDLPLKCLTVDLIESLEIDFQFTFQHESLVFLILSLELFACVLIWISH